MAGDASLPAFTPMAGPSTHRPWRGDHEQPGPSGPLAVSGGPDWCLEQGGRGRSLVAANWRSQLSFRGGKVRRSARSAANTSLRLRTRRPRDSAPPSGSGCSAGSQVFNLPYRRIAFGRAAGPPGREETAAATQVPNLRYSRLQICATGQSAVPGRMAARRRKKLKRKLIFAPLAPLRGYPCLACHRQLNTESLNKP